jgi:hypothetical protein
VYIEKRLAIYNSSIGGLGLLLRGRLPFLEVCPDAYPELDSMAEDWSLLNDRRLQPEAAKGG